MRDKIILASRFWLVRFCVTAKLRNFSWRKLHATRIPPRASVALTRLYIAMKATQALFRRARRLQLTTKQVNKGYYKGTGSGSMGTHTKHGRYMLDPWKIRTYIVPLSLEQFHVSVNVSVTPLSKIQG